MKQEAPGGITWAYSSEAEQSTIGALLLDSEAFEQVAEIVSAGDFYLEDHATLFRAIATLRRRGEIADVVTIGEHLNRSGLLTDMVTSLTAYAAALTQSTPTALNVMRYAEIVRQRSQYRRLDVFAQELSQGVRQAGAREPGEILRDARGALQALTERTGGTRQLRADSAGELINLELPPLEVLMAPWLFQKTLGMIHAKRGVGKTHLALAVAYAVATGTAILGWSAPRARGVLYVDGEMPAQLMQKRLGELSSGYGDVPDLLRIVTPDRQDRPMPDLATAAGQAEIDALMAEETALIVIDNLSCLVRSGGAENESESWGAVSEWALKHRRGGRAVLFIHHSGKSGAQRGTSKREDLLDIVINLRRPPEHQEADGAVFTVHFEKARSLTGEDIAPIEAKLEQLAGGGQAWTCRAAADVVDAHAVDLWEGGGVTLNDVARELGINKSTAHRKLQAAMDAGRLKRAYPTRRKKEGG